MTIKEMFKEAEIGLSKYKNIIGIGVIFMFIIFSSIFLYTYFQERKIAEDCGFANEKIKCVCTKQAWDDFKLKEDVSWNSQIPIDLNSSLYIENNGKKENHSSIEK